MHRHLLVVLVITVVCIRHPLVVVMETIVLYVNELDFVHITTESRAYNQTEHL